MNEQQSQQTSGDQSPNVHTDSGAVNITYNTQKTSWVRIIPDYLAQLVKLVPAPRKFFAGLNYTQKEPLVQGLVFLSLSSLLAYLMRMPLAGEASGYWSQALISMVSFIVTGLVFGVLAFGCCRIVGGRAQLSAHIAIFGFIAGVSAVLFALVSLLAQAIILIEMKPNFPLYLEYMQLVFDADPAIKQPRFAILEQGWALMASMGTILAGCVGILLWMAAAWRGMGDLNNLSSGRVAFSLVLFLMAGLAANKVLAELQAIKGVTVF